jgi:hypothetical protein
MKFDPRDVLALRLTATELLKAAAIDAQHGEWTMAHSHGRDACDLLQLAYLSLSGKLDAVLLASRYEQLKARAAKKGGLVDTWNAALNAVRPYLGEGSRGEA